MYRNLFLIDYSTVIFLFPFRFDFVFLLFYFQLRWHNISLYGELNMYAYGYVYMHKYTRTLLYLLIQYSSTANSWNITRGIFIAFIRHLQSISICILCVYVCMCTLMCVYVFSVYRVVAIVVVAAAFDSATVIVVGCD